MPARTNVNASGVTQPINGAAPAQGGKLGGKRVQGKKWPMMCHRAASALGPAPGAPRPTIGKKQPNMDVARRRRKPGQAARMEMKQLMGYKTRKGTGEYDKWAEGNLKQVTKLEIPKVAMHRLCKDILEDVALEVCDMANFPQGIRLSADATEALREASQMFLINVFGKSTRIVDAVKKQTLDPENFFLTMVTADEMKPEDYRQKTGKLF